MQKVESVITQSDCETTRKKENNYPLCLQALEKCEKLKNIDTQNDYKTMSKDWTDKTKQTSSLCFVNVFKFQENKFKIV